MGIEPIKGFFESDSGERIIGHVLAYKSKSDFLEKAQKYISESRDEYTPVSDNVRMEHYILTSYDDTLYRQDVAEERNIQGEELLFYETDTLYDFEYYTFSEKEQDRIDDVLKELNIIYLHNGKNFPFDKWAIPVISYIEDLDEYQKAEVRKIFTQKRERGEWS